MQVDWAAMNEEARDDYLAEYCLDKYEEGASRQKLAVLLAALHKVFPRQRFRTSAAVLLTWALKAPPRQAPAVPSEFCEAICVVCALLGAKDVGVLLRLCFWGLLRVSEAISLQWKDIIMPQTVTGYVTLLLGRTKRGQDQKVVVESVDMVVWLSKYAASAAPSSAAFPCTYNRVLRTLRKATAFLKLGADFTTHSFRRGGATARLIRNDTIENIMIAGRWKSLSSCREYLKRGEVYQLRFLAETTRSVTHKVELLSSLSHQCLDIEKS